MKNKFYEFYKEKYDLKNLNIQITNNKILFLIFDDYNYYYLKNEKFLTTDEDISILKTIKDINQNFKLEIFNYYPVCFCKKTLIIALRTSSINKSILKKVKYNKVIDKYKVLIDYHRNNFDMFYISSNVEKEIYMSKKYINRYKFHENFIKKFILSEKKRKKVELKNILFNFLPNKESIIDVSCGDNSDIFDIAIQKKYKTIVGNDICINYLYTQKRNKVIYTNDDIELNSIRENSYDVSFCKNTLHHMNNITNINNVLTFLNKISKQIIIIEIMNPKEYKGLPKILNKYLYTKFLRDVGNCYINEKQLKKVISNNFYNHNVEYKKFKNILGEYMIVNITRK